MVSMGLAAAKANAFVSRRTSLAMTPHGNWVYLLLSATCDKEVRSKL
jgi:hypothetical protein